MKAGNDRKSDAARSAIPTLEIVLKCDSTGSLEAVTHALSQGGTDLAGVAVIHSAVGNITKSDVMLAETGSGLVIGFQVGVLPGLDRALKEHRVEVRLYNIIYNLINGLKGISGSMRTPIQEEQIVGSAKVIALFKSTRKGIILGCEVLEGSLAVGQNFRIVSATGPAYEGRIESLHIEEDAVPKASKGQKVGLKIRDFKEARTGDLVETFRSSTQKTPVWRPSGQIIRG